MCGWVVWWRPGTTPDRNRLRRARDLMTSRGPDDAGLWQRGSMGIGHRRLAILDLSAAGRQPMERHGVVVAFNGEIYNHRLLREELAGRGADFRSDSDTEVLPLGFREWGWEGLLDRLDGMFSIALWDRAGERLYLARDRMGKKPLFYALGEWGLVAASDLKSVVACLPEAPRIDASVLPLYLYHGFIPAPWTVFDNVAKLEPATAATIYRDGRGLARTAHRYWRPHAAPALDIHAGEAEEQVEALLREAVRRRLLADVPVGTFLSGGVDSSLVTALAAGASPGIRSFSVGFTHESHNELPFARRVAGHVGTTHTETVLEVDVLAELGQILWNHGEPFADSSAVPSHAVAREARRAVTVVLTGDGGDEIFAGYPTARAAWLAGYLRRFVGERNRRRLGVLFEQLLSGRPLPGPLSSLWSLVRFGATPDGLVYLDPDLWRDDLRRHLLAPGTAVRGGISPRAWHAILLDGVNAEDDLHRMLLLDLETRLPNDYLTKVDVATMAAGLEARSPLLDRALVEFALRLPRDILLPLGESKGLLKRICARHVPPAVVYRPKAGFALPLGAWMRGPYRDALCDTLLGAPNPWFNRATVHRTLAEHMSGAFDHSARLWSIYTWLRWEREVLPRLQALRTGEPGFEAAA